MAKQSSYLTEKVYRNFSVGQFIFCRLLLICVIFSAFSFKLQAQNQPQRQQQRPAFDSTYLQNADRLFNKEAREDTLEIYAFTADNPFEKLLLIDSLLDDNLLHYDAVRRGDLFLGSLGSTGNASYPLYYRQLEQNGLDIGYNQYEPYLMQSDEAIFYQPVKTFTHLNYSQGIESEDQLLRAQFGRHFDDGFLLAVNYERTQSQGIYDFSESDHSALHLGLGYETQNDKYKAYLSYISNSIKQEDNGGIQSDTFFGKEQFEEAITIPINLETAISKISRRKVDLYHHYSLIAPDSTNTNRRLILSHNASFTAEDYRISDTGPSAEFYNTLFADSRGLRVFQENNVLENHFKISTYKPSKTLTAGGNSNLVTVGIKHQQHRIDNELQVDNISNISLTGSGSFNIKDRILLQTDNHIYVVGRNAGDYKISGKLTIDLSNIGRLNLELLNQNYQPTIIQNEMVVSQIPVWNQSFNVRNDLTLKGAYFNPELKINLGLDYHLLSNYIFFGTDFVPFQQSSSINIAQVWVNHKLSLGNLQMDNHLAFQSVSGSRLNLPSFISKSRLYYNNYVFKNKMFLKTGVELRTADRFFANGYQAIVGDFYIQDESETPFYLGADFFLSFKVKRMRATFKLENLEDLWSSDTQKFYFISQYPLNDLAFRFGISWFLIN